jgi:hypothetical protein
MEMSGKLAWQVAPEYVFVMANKQQVQRLPAFLSICKGAISYP